MKPRGPLMIEHRLIEKIFVLVKKEALKVGQGKRLDPIFIDTVVDFVKTYADRTHHGKEEDILFRDLEKKNLSEKDLIIMQELIEEHKYGREMETDPLITTSRFTSGTSSFTTEGNEKPKDKHLITLNTSYLIKETFNAVLELEHEIKDNYKASGASFTIKARF